jgi:hypothetical protein
MSSAQLNQIRIWASCATQLKKLERTRPRIIAFIREKLSRSGILSTNPALVSHNGYTVYKVSITTRYGHFRLIVLEDCTILGIAVYEVYAKNTKADLTPSEYRTLRNTLDNLTPAQWAELPIL